MLRFREYLEKYNKEEKKFHTISHDGIKITTESGIIIKDIMSYLEKKKNIVELRNKKLFYTRIHVRSHVCKLLVTKFFCSVVVNKFSIYLFFISIRNWPIMSYLR